MVRSLANTTSPNQGTNPIYFDKFRIKPIPQGYPLCGMNFTVDGLHFAAFCEGTKEHLCTRPKSLADFKEMTQIREGRKALPRLGETSWKKHR